MTQVQRAPFLVSNFLLLNAAGAKNQAGLMAGLTCKDKVPNGRTVKLRGFCAESAACLRQTAAAATGTMQSKTVTSAQLAA
ncbi:MAG: hypothetical protein ABSC01_06655 [Verrucomicrobiota bacterium]|jgi:hypothetical protein